VQDARHCRLQPALVRPARSYRAHLPGAIYARRAMANRLLAVVTGALLLVALSSCGESTPSSTNAPANTPGATPNDATTINCPADGGPSSGNLTGLGATIDQFRQAHPQDPKYPSDFGATISGGVNDGLHELSARCSTGGVIVSVDQNFSKTMSAAKVKASMIGLGIAPADSKLKLVQTIATCQLLFYMSASIASDPGANDTAGTFLVELQPPAAAGMTWTPNNVASLIYDLDEAGGC
jgi:hypothetical protein